MCFLFSMKKLTHLKSAQTQVQLQIQVQAQHMDLRREARYTSPISRTWWLWSTKHPCSRLQMDSYRSCALRHLYARASVGLSRSSSGRFCHALFRSHSRCIWCLGLGRSLIPGNTQRHMVQRVKLEKRHERFYQHAVRVYKKNTNLRATETGASWPPSLHKKICFLKILSLCWLSHVQPYFSLGSLSTNWLCEGLPQWIPWLTRSADRRVKPEQRTSFVNCKLTFFVCLK